MRMTDKYVESFDDAQDIIKNARIWDQNINFDVSRDVFCKLHESGYIYHTYRCEDDKTIVCEVSGLRGSIYCQIPEEFI